MKIFNNAPIGGPQGVRRKSKTGSAEGADFASMLEEAEETAAAGAAAPTASVSGMDMLLSIQGVSGDEVNRKKAYRHAGQTLDALDDLRKAILIGDVGPRHLISISQKIDQMRLQTNDPKLQAILDDIELRAAVELAKLDTK